MKILRGILIAIIIIIGIALVFGIAWGVNTLFCAAIIKLISLIAPITFTWKLSAIVGTILLLITTLKNKPFTNSILNEVKKRSS